MLHLLHAIESTVVTSGILFVIIFGANLFSFFMVQTQLPGVLAEGAQALNLSGPVVMTLIIFAYIVFGCFLEAIGMLLITVPVFLPLVKQFGYDPVWFGIIVVIVAEVGLIHPPMGMNLFVIQANAPDIKITSIYRGIVPFLFAPLLLIVLLFLFPSIALWLPKLVLRRRLIFSALFHHLVRRAGAHQIDGVVIRAAAQEDEETGHPVGFAKAEHVDIEF